MSGIQRWEVDNIISSKTHYKFEKGRYVLYADHVAAMQAVRPQPKFKVGDVVTSSPWPEPWIIEQVEYAAFADTWCYFGADGFYKFECNLTLHVPLIPDPKFKVGDRVTWKRMQGSRIVESSIFRPYNNTYEYYIKGTGKLCLSEDDLELYVPTPAELIPTLKEHEWVRGTTGEGEFMGTVFPSRPYPEGRGVSAGRQTLRHSHGGISRSILTIERCDAPVVK